MKINWYDFIDAMLLALGLISIFVVIIMMALYDGSPIWMLGWIFSAVTLSLSFGRKK